MAKYEDILKELKAGKYAPVYFLTGDEAFYIDKIADYIEEHALAEEEKEFNLTILYGKDGTAGQILEAAKRFPMMAERQVVILREAQTMKGIEDLEAYVKNPVPSTVLVICFKEQKIDQRRTFGKLIVKKSVYLNSEKLRDYQIGGWITKYLEKKNLKITPVGVNLLSESLGTNLSKICNELDKLAIVVPAGKEITPEIIQRNIGISKDFNIFELQRALGAKDAKKAHQIINYFGSNKSNPLILTIASLYGYFSKIMLLHYSQNKTDQNLASTLRVNPFFVKEYKAAAKNYSAAKIVRIISDLREFDLKAKGVGNDSVSANDLGRELVARIMAN